MKKSISLFTAEFWVIYAKSIFPGAFIKNKNRDIFTKGLT